MQLYFLATQLQRSSDFNLQILLLQLLFVPKVDFGLKPLAPLALIVSSMSVLELETERLAAHSESV